MLPPGLGEGFGVISYETYHGLVVNRISLCEKRTAVIVVAFPAFVASLTYPTPCPSDRFMLRRSRQLHLIHGMLFAEQLSAFPAIDATIAPTQPLPAHRLGARIVGRSSLPMFLRDDLVRVSHPYAGLCTDIHTASLLCRRTRRGGGVVRFENVQPLQFLVQDRQRLKPFRLGHLVLEPCLDLILLDFLEIGVVVVKVSDDCASGSGRTLDEECSRHVVPVQLEQSNLT